MAEPVHIGNVEILHGDCREVMRGLPDASVHCVICSPPYWGLRDYGNPPSVWGGDEKCAHDFTHEVIDKSKPGTSGSGLTNAGAAQAASNRFVVEHGFCRRCNAWRGNFGLEPTLGLHIEHLVEIFREVRRVLRPDGTVWLNYGDCYATGVNGRSAADTKALSDDDRTFRDKPFSTVGDGLKTKDLCMMPARVALALQADGWLLRSEIIWAKANPMPESIRDRPTSAHEKIYLLSKCEWRGIEPLRLSDVDVVWLAAMIDAEGSVCINRKRYGKRQINPTYAARLCCYNTHKPIIDRIVAMTGVGKCSARKDCPGRIVYQWQVAGPRTVPIIAAIEPYLMAKRQQASLALELQTAPKRHGNRPGFGKGAMAKSDEVVGREREIYEACSSLNKTGETGIEVRPWKHGRWITRPYYFDAEAVREPTIGRTVHDLTGQGYETPSQTRQNGNRKTKMPDGWDTGPGAHGSFHRSGREKGRTRGLPPRHAQYESSDRTTLDDVGRGAGRNLRNVWNIATQPFAAAHFATMPEKLVEPCIKAGTSERGCCPECGAGWRRNVNVRYEIGGPKHGANAKALRYGRDDHRHEEPYKTKITKTLGWSPSCDCPAHEPVQCVVMDPFGGSGTVGVVAHRLNRRALLIELNQEYIEIATRRIEAATAQGDMFIDDHGAQGAALGTKP